MNHFTVRHLLANRPPELPEQPVLPAHRIAKRGVEAGAIERQESLVELQAEVLGFLDNPVERLVGQPVGSSTAADVDMRAGKPRLLQGPVPVRDSLPDVRRKWFPALVDRQRV